ncbi:MAG: isoaspartyl peptidase/L-asparaginase [Stygiobacter sp.]
MKISRRNFVKTAAIAGSGLLINHSFSNEAIAYPKSKNIIAVSTWETTIKSTEKAYELLKQNKTSLDAIEYGIRVAEDDPENTTVGYGGAPDEDGIETLDASIMDWNSNAGSVAAVENIKNVISLARLVMEKTKHVMLAGNGAKKFALENGMKEENLLTEKSKQNYLEWKSKNINQNRIDHDTIGMLAIDSNGNISGGVSTSGLAYKIHGRVGDSPIIGAALFVDNEIGGAVATGLGELVMRTCGAFLIVEKMREGYSPEQACKIATERIRKLLKKNETTQVGYIALRKDGKIGTYSLSPNFTYCVASNNKNENYKSKFLIK